MYILYVYEKAMYTSFVSEGAKAKLKVIENTMGKNFADKASE